MRVWPGKPFPRGATFDGHGVNFAVYSRVATRVEVCLYDPADPAREIDRFDLPGATGCTWHGYVPELAPGALYGFRVHGPYAPARGHRCNPSKLLVDPYAKAIWGEVDWTQPVFGYKPGDADEQPTCRSTSATARPACPRAWWSTIASTGATTAARDALAQTVIYETHVRGFTKLHPDVPERAARHLRRARRIPPPSSTSRSSASPPSSCCPSTSSPTTDSSQDASLRNYWGYSTLGFFAPEQRYASRAHARARRSPSSRRWSRRCTPPGIEVILDVVYNHTCEGNHLGPDAVSLRGIDNATYYWLMPDARYYLDFTGTGNSVNASNPEAARLIVDSLRYWVDADARRRVSLRPRRRRWGGWGAASSAAGAASSRSSRRTRCSRASS